MVRTLWDSITEFLSPEAGQRRTQALQEFGRDVEYYVPPELRGLLGFAAEMTPSETLSRAGQAGGEMLAPGRTPMERVGSAGRMLSETAGVAAPIAVSQRAGMTAAQALQEGLLGASVAADDVGRRFVERMSQPGPVPTMYSVPAGFALDETGSVGRGVSLPTPRNDAEAMARDILEMRAAGRAGDVTDEMMAAADPQYMFANTPLPMDEASRMARAREMGFDLGGLLTHGSKRDIYGFSLDAPKSTDFGWYGQGISLAPNDPRISDAYAMVEKEGVGQWTGRTYPVTSKGRTYEWPASNPPATSLEQSKEITQSLRDLGYERANIYAPDDPDVWGPAAGSWREQVVYDPTNIRSRFARFDPEFRHLRNLSAGVAGGGLLATQPTEQEREEEIRQYLGGLL